ncbi:MAG: metallophosphoesterase [Porphyromonadaceae bacterium]|nr:metallophosphoesterase [Porphyromonadaceae bacterium]
MVYIYSIIYRLILYPYLLWRGHKALSQTWYRRLRMTLLVEFILALLGVLIHRYIQHPLMSFYMSMGLFIFFSLGYASVFALVMNGLKLLDQRYLGWYTKLSAGIKTWTERLVWLVSGVIFLGTMYSGYHNVADPEIKHHRLIIDRLTKPSIPAEHRLRLALLTDLHIGEGITPGYIEQAVELTLAEKPDLVLIGGDYIDHDHKYAYTEQVMQAMRRLTQVPYGVYYVLGNHEYRVDTLANMRWVEQVGGTLLVDSVAQPAGGLINLIGRDDYVNRSRAMIEQLTHGLDTSRPTILLEHTPEALDSLKGESIDLALYGHTHGGQLWPMPLLIWLKYGITSGTKQVGGTEVCVTSGVGAAGAPYRIGTRSELVIYDLYW